MSWISARIRFVAQGADGKSIGADDAQRVVDQVRADALFGTFAELDDAFWQPRMDRQPASLSQAELSGVVDNDLETGLKRYEFELKLADDLFPPRHGGIQHLFGILAGDLLQFTLPPITIRKVEILNLELPGAWWTTQNEAFRDNASNSVAEIRRQFAIEDGMPFLAFSFKPRVGFRIEALEEVAKSVLEAGFNLVELDTRFLPGNDQLEQLHHLAVRLAEHGPKSHVGRLSINLSLPPDLLLEHVERLCRDISPPVVFKVDGGLDGMSGLQAVRRKGFTDANKSFPIITCYPLLRSTLARYVPADVLIDALGSSGADIVYPGGRPDLGKMLRSLGGPEETSHAHAIGRYRRFVSRGWPMPSIAGGIYAGQLQAFYELLGPDVAWFLGGGVALHREGPMAGARLCVKIAKEAAALRAKAGRNWADNLRGKLPEECEAMYAGRSSLSGDQLQFVSAKEVLAKIGSLMPFAE